MMGTVLALSLLFPATSFAAGASAVSAEEDGALAGAHRAIEDANLRLGDSLHSAKALSFADSGIALYANDNTIWWKDNGVWYGSNGAVVYGAVGFGVDVSEHQGRIDWSQVSSSGVTYAIIRCGYGSDYSSQDDDWFLYNVGQCQRYGIPFGVYLYSYATDTSMAQSEADHTLRLLQEAGLSPYSLSYPVYYDMEDEWHQAYLSPSALGSVAAAYCNAIAAAGYTPGVYASTSWWNKHLTDTVFNSWPRWVAQYNYRCTYAGKYGMWQADSQALINGIAGGVDINFDFAGPIYHEDTWIYSNGAWWYRYVNGSYPVNSWACIKGKWYHFDSSGWMQTGWVCVDGSWYYLAPSGEMLVGWQHDGHAWYYLQPNSGAMKTGWLKDGESWYWLGGSGAMQVGWANVNGSWYYMSGSGAMLDEWQWISGSWYYFDSSSGAMCTGWLKEDSDWYWLNSSGAMLSDGWVCVSGSWYRAASSGILLTDWQTTGGQKYWFDTKSCAMATGWKKIEDAWYFFGSSGAAATGWVYESGSWYYCDANGVMQVGTLAVGSSTYHFDASGRMSTGWLQIDDLWYHFATSGAMTVSKWVGDYYLGEDGVMAVSQWIGPYYVGDDGKWIPGYSDKADVPDDSKGSSELGASVG